jgi:hypothetical protein
LERKLVDWMVGWTAEYWVDWWVGLLVEHWAGQ